MKTSEAVQELINTLMNDADFRMTYQANIAMAFQDEFRRWCESVSGRNNAPDHIHEIANRAAHNFLNQFCESKLEYQKP